MFGENEAEQDWYLPDNDTVGRLGEKRCHFFPLDERPYLQNGKDLV